MYVVIAAQRCFCDVTTPICPVPCFLQSKWSWKELVATVYIIVFYMIRIFWMDLDCISVKILTRYEKED